jgi:hypothetical protein
MKAVNYLSFFYQSAGYELKEAQQDKYIPIAPEIHAIRFKVFIVLDFN